jgi:hypothetical protein
MAARQAGASLAGSRKRVPSRPTCRAAALIGLGAAVFANRTLLESTMAQSSPAHISAPTFPQAKPSKFNCRPTHNAVACVDARSDTKRKRPAPRCRAGQAMAFLPCYSHGAAPVKRSRDWRPVESPRRKPWSLFRRVCGFPNHLESLMTKSFPARISVPTSPIGGTPPIQLNADAHHARNMAVRPLPALRNLWLMEASS